MIRHDFYMGESKFPAPDDFDHSVTTVEVVKRIAEQIRAEADGHTLRIIVHTFRV